MGYGEFSYYSDSPTIIKHKKVVGALSEIIVGTRARYEADAAIDNELPPDAIYVIMAIAPPCLTGSLHGQNFMCAIANEITGECRVTLLTNLALLIENKEDSKKG